MAETGLKLSTYDARDKSLYRYWTTEHVRYADLEVQRHVNNMVIGVYFQSGRLGLLGQLGILWSTPEHTIVVARTINDFYQEIVYPNNLDIGVVISRMGNTSFTMQTGVFIGDHCCASQEATCIYWNPVKHEKRVLDDSVREKLSQFLVS